MSARPIAGSFRTLRRAESVREDLSTKWRDFFRTDELCRHPVRTRIPSVSTPCGKRAAVEVDGKWYCRRHAKKVTG